MRVVVIGGGIGGLVLAHGLRAVDVEVTVHDRDLHAADTGGYRLHLDSAAMEALRRCVSPAIHRALLASGSGPRMMRSFTMFDHRLNPLLHLRRRPTSDDLQIGRRPLRTILTHGLEKVVRFGHEFTGFVRNPDGTVTAHFADGDTDHADLLVGADGVHSAVATALAGRPIARRLHLSGLAGRTRITDSLRGLLPAELNAGPAFAIGPAGVAAFLSLHDPASAVVDPADCLEVAARLEDPYLLWAAISERHDADARSRAHHRADADAVFDGWAPALRELIRCADGESIGVFPYYTTDPARLMPWRAGPVTALGDAVHPMPPTGGRGAATAIRDADHLVRRIQQAGGSRAGVTSAVEAYQQEITEYSAAAISDSQRPLAWRRVLRNPVLFHLARRILPVVDHALPVAAAARRH